MRGEATSGEAERVEGTSPWSVKGNIEVVSKQLSLAVLSSLPQ